jgi:uncharacterized protein (TIGR02001 family)
MKKLIIASAITAAFAGSFAHAEEAAAPEHVVAYNLGATTDYVFRGISQSRNTPALSGGVDYTHSPTGMYLGTWASTISWVNDSTPAGTVGNTPFELDLYGGKRGEIGAGVAYDVGAIYYYYANHKLTGFDANTLEVYGQVGYGPVYLKVNYGVTDVINTGASGSYYVDTGANVPVMEGVTLNLHAGYFSFKDNSAANYTDWKVGMTKDFGGLTGALAVTGTDASKSVWDLGSQGYLGNTKFIATVTKTF